MAEQKRESPFLTHISVSPNYYRKAPREFASRPFTLYTILHFKELNPHTNAGAEYLERVPKTGDFVLGPEKWSRISMHERTLNFQNVTRNRVK